jgi:hypothetical protein
MSRSGLVVRCHSGNGQLIGSCGWDAIFNARTTLTFPARSLLVVALNRAADAVSKIAANRPKQIHGCSYLWCMWGLAF